MKLIFFLSLAAFAVYPEAVCLIPAGFVSLIVIGRGIVYAAIQKMAKDIHNEQFRNK